MMFTKTYTITKAKVLAVNSPYESFSGLRQEIELDVGTVKMKLYDLIFAIDETWVGRECDWRLRDKGTGLEGHPLEP